MCDGRLCLSEGSALEAQEKILRLENASRQPARDITETPACDLSKTSSNFFP